MSDPLKFVDYFNYTIAPSAINLGTSGTAQTLTAGTPLQTLYSTCSSTSTSTVAEPFYMKSTMTGAGGIGGRARFHLYTNVALGSYANALKGYTEYGASGRTTGLGSAVCAEILLSAGTSSGTYAPLESEVVINTGGSTGTATSFLYCNATGTLASAFDTSGFLFQLGAGMTAASGKILYNNTIRVKVGSTTWYLPLSSAEGTYTSAYPVVLTNTLTVGVDDDGKDVTFYGERTGSDFFWDENGQTNGSLNLGTTTVSEGVDFFAHGDSASNYLHWDCSADDLLLVGTATQLAVAGTTDASSTTTGSLRTAGGLGVAKKLYVGTDINVAGEIITTSDVGLRTTGTMVPDSTRTDYFLSCGNRVTELGVAIAASTGQNIDPIQMNINITGSNPTASSQINMIYSNITHDTTAMTNMRLKNADWVQSIGVNVKDAYIFQGEIDFSGTCTVGGEACILGMNMNAGSGTLTASEKIWGIRMNMQGASMPTGTARANAALFTHYQTSGGSFWYSLVDSAKTVTAGWHLNLTGSVTSLIDIINSTNLTNLLLVSTSGGAVVYNASFSGQSAAEPDASIAVSIDGNTKYLYAFPTAVS